MRAQAHIVSGLAECLDPDRFEIAALFLEGPGPLVGELEARCVDTRPLAFRGGHDARGALRYVQELRARRPAIVHFHVGGRSRVWLARASSAKRIGHVHGYADDGSEPSGEELVRGVDAVVATSRAAAAGLGVPATVVYPGVRLPTLGGRSHAARSPTVGTVARLESVKGVELLLEAAARLRGEHPDLRVDVAGTGSAAGALQARQRALGLERTVRFLGWSDDPSSLYDGWDAFVVPSRREGFGFAALEAMASGLPVVASRTGGLPELVVDGKTGYLVAPGDVGALAQRIAELLQSPERRAAMGAAGRNRAADHFSLERMAGAMAGVYESVGARPAGR
jgi:glycosyltransferase involved in cell wall biosynthesis